MTSVVCLLLYHANEKPEDPISTSHVCWINELKLSDHVGCVWWFNSFFVGHAILFRSPRISQGKFPKLSKIEISFHKYFWRRCWGYPYIKVPNQVIELSLSLTWPCMNPFIVERLSNWKQHMSIHSNQSPPENPSKETSILLDSLNFEWFC